MYYTYDGLGTAIQEVGGAGRSLTVLGAPLGSLYSFQTTCENAALPTFIPQPYGFLDLTSVPKDREAIIALIHIYGFAYGQGIKLEWKWYRDRDSKLIGDWGYSLPSLPPYEYYTYWSPTCLMGYLSAPINGWDEIEENGSYHVDIFIDDVKIQTYSFIVIGIPAPFVGKRTSIWGVDAPSQSKPGDTVHVNFNIQSLYTQGQQYVFSSLTPDVAIVISWTYDEPLLSYGESQHVQETFLMPDVSVLYLTIRSYWWNGSNWVEDDQYSLQITRQVPVPVITVVPVIITNTSTRSGTPVSVSLVIYAWDDNGAIGVPGGNNQTFQASEAKTINFNMSNAKPFTIRVDIYSPAGNRLDSATKTIT